MKAYKVLLFLITATVLLGSGCATSKYLPKDIRKASPEQIAELKATMMKGTTMRTIKAPLNFPEQRRWAPRRYFGALYGNSPDLHLNGQAANFVYDQYFSSHPDASVFQKYYGTPLPSSTPTLPSAIPGTIPGTTGGFLDTRLGFNQLTYSSRYGGSFRLSFRSLEDFQVEYRKGSDAWDIASLEVLIYVRPVKTYFNPNNPIYSVPIGNVHVEFRPQGVIGYTVSGSNLTVKDGDPLPDLMTALAESAKTMVGTGGANLHRDSTLFSHGLVHAAFWEEIGQTNNVTAIEISDGFFFPRTSAGRPVAVVSVQAHDVRLDTETGNEEIYITVNASHMFEGVNPPPSFAWDYHEIDHRGTTEWKTVGVFPLDWDCGQLQSVILLLTIREDDTVDDDRFGTDPGAFQTRDLDCSGMQTAFDNGQFGFYENLPDEQLLIVDDDEVEGALTVRMRISVIKQ